MRQYYWIFLSLLMGYLPSYAQSKDDQAGGCEIWGQVVTPGDPLENGLNIELIGKSGRRQRVPLVNGNFDFDAVPQGPYQFRIIDSNGQELLKRAKLLTGPQEHVILVAPFKRSEAQSTPYTVSFRELSNRSLRQAQDAFRASEKALDAGELEKSIKCLEKAIALDPQFAEAHLNLATEYLQIGRVEKALEHFESAFNVSPGLPEAAYDLAMLFIITEKYSQAEVVARRALENHEALPGMHGLLAVSLLWQHRNFGEAYEHLRRAVSFPIARLLAANALAAGGRLRAAAAQVRQYLSKSAHQCERKELQSWLARLDLPQSSASEVRGEAQ